MKKLLLAIAMTLGISGTANATDNSGLTDRDREVIKLLREKAAARRHINEDNTQG